VNTWDAMAYRAVFEGRAVAYAKAGLTIQAAVWAMGADMCRAAVWTARYGPFEAERRVRCQCRDE
jgi:hypothetical protein